MIITKEWLSEWIDIKDIETDTIAKELNSIGLEVDSINKIRIPKNVVVGLVLTCEKHPDADKLNICQVDIGGKVEQIVCGAKNVASGQMVAVAKVGSVLPGNFKIKPAKLRGVESNGMICSSEELGLPKINDGIMVLDESIGELKLGKELSEFPLLNDDIIELELTANRGDCLSIHGVARDLCVPFELDMKPLEIKEEDDNQLGVGRVLNVTVGEKIESSFVFKALDNTKIESNLLIDLRLALVGESDDDALGRLLTYSTYSTGVLLRAYSYDVFNHKDEIALIVLKKQKNGLDAVLGKKLVSFVGVSQEPDSKASADMHKIILEANYSAPEVISENTYDKKLTADRHLYRSSRGSEPDLDFGINFLTNTLQNTSDIMVYAGSQQVIQDYDEVIINLHLVDLNNMIGVEIPKSRVVDILKKLGFSVVFNHEQERLKIVVPAYRHDIQNKQDICEEIVRMVGIDNIESKPLVFSQSTKHNTSYINFKKRQSYRCKAAQSGFFESLHFIFDDKKRNLEYGFKPVQDKLDVLNPITSELNSLRVSLIPNMLDSVSKNTKYGKKSIPLFEIGTVFDKARKESIKMAFVFCGEDGYGDISNHGKPSEINFYSFARKISNTIGEFDLIKSKPANKLCNPYEYAVLEKDGVQIGYMSRLHSNIQNDFDLYKTYICELDFDGLRFDKRIVEPYSSFQAISRDLSLLVPSDMPYSKIADFVKKLKIENLIEFSAVDLYESEKLGDKVSLTMRFSFQAADKTLKDEDISGAIEKILSELKSKFGIEIR
jgi:phenylalanyl-tRNA synthetase beta chain